MCINFQMMRYLRLLNEILTNKLKLLHYKMDFNLEMERKSSWTLQNKEKILMKLDEELTVMIYLGLLNSLIDHIEGDFRQSIFNKQSLKTNQIWFWMNC